jgi:hypothetical protein
MAWPVFVIILTDSLETDASAKPFDSIPVKVLQAEENIKIARM